MPAITKGNQKAIYALCASFLVALLAIFGLGQNLNTILKTLSLRSVFFYSPPFIYSAFVKTAILRAAC